MDAFRIMLVDDELQVLNALERLLQSERWPEVQAPVLEKFTSPREARDAALDRPFGLALVAYRLRGVDAMETLRSLRAAQPDMARIVLCGSRDFEPLLRSFNPMEISRVLMKPWFDAELMAAVRQALEQRRLVMENRALAEELRRQRAIVAQQDDALHRLETGVVTAVDLPRHPI